MDGVCNTDAQYYVVMPTASRSYRSSFGTPDSHLLSSTGWRAGKDSVGQYIQFDLGGKRMVKGVATRGSESHNSWVTKFKIQTSMDGTTWNVESNEMDANFDKTTIVKTLLPIAAVAKYIRIVPTVWKNHIAMRATVVLGDSDCIGILF